MPATMVERAACSALTDVGEQTLVETQRGLQGRTQKPGMV